ncbi:MAG: SRPBCC domain-containing protein [Acidimicrobiia bacterium]|nr:SRPBCC domain-containing protein [Acidimicrobiia bacterium]
MVASGEVVEITGNKVSFTWGWGGHPDLPPGGTIVEIELFPDGDGTLVRLTHSGLEAGDVPMHLKGWNHYLARLTTAASGGNPGPDPGAG